MAYYLYDGERVLAELNSSGAVVNLYGYGAAGLAQRYDATHKIYYAYTFDPSGNLVERTSPNNITNGTYSDFVTLYDGFGQQLGQVSSSGVTYTSVDTIGFSGEWGCITDNETAPTMAGNPTYRIPVVWMGHREYDPSVGRFLTRDPAGYEGGINLYAYCGDNPILNADPMGWGDGDDDDDNSGVNWKHLSMGAGAKGRNVNQSVHRGASLAEKAAVFLADLHPWSAIAKFLYGKDNEGKKISTGARLGNGALAMVPVLGGIGDVVISFPWAAKAVEVLTPALKGEAIAPFNCIGAYMTSVKTLSSADIPYQSLVIEKGEELFLKNGSKYSTTGYHVAVRVGDRVFDNLTGPKGWTWKYWLSKLQLKASDVRIR